MKSFSTYINEVHLTLTPGSVANTFLVRVPASKDGTRMIKDIENAIKKSKFTLKDTGSAMIDGKRVMQVRFGAKGELRDVSKELDSVLMPVDGVDGITTLRKAVTEEIINEKKVQSVDGMAAELADLTHHNDHTEAALRLAKYLGATKYVKILSKISEIQDLERSMPEGLGKYKYEILQNLKAIMKQNLSSDDAQKLWMSL